MKLNREILLHPASFKFKYEHLYEYLHNERFLPQRISVVSGTPLVSHDRINGRTSCQFTQKDGLSQLIDEYYADHVKVSPIRYGNSLKNLKALIYSGNANTNRNGKPT